MALKKLADIQQKEDDFIKGADREKSKRETIKRDSKKGNVKTDDTFTKQTIKLDENRYLKIIKHCKKNKKTFQSFMTELIDDFLK